MGLATACVIKGLALAGKYNVQTYNNRLTVNVAILHVENVFGRVVEFGFFNLVMEPAQVGRIPGGPNGGGFGVAVLLTLRWRGFMSVSDIVSTVAGIGYTATCVTENESCEI